MGEPATGTFPGTASEVDARPPPPVGGRSNDTLIAIQNALTLGGSLIFTWGIALGMRLLLPRYLGPDLLGTLSFADAFTAMFFVALSLGADVYVRKEVTLRPAHASEFFGGTLVLRVVMSLFLFGAMAIVLQVTNRPPEIRTLVYVVGVAQFFVQTNSTLSALLHARGRVAGMSALAVASKVLWAGGVIIALVFGLRVWAYGAAFLVSEGLESLFLFGLAKRHLGLVLRLDLPATKAMILSSLPYYLNVFATTAYGKLDVSWLTMVGTQSDVGWYAASSAVAGLTLLLTPLIGWVLMPTFAKAAARSREDLFHQIRGATEIILAVAIPMSLLLVLGADLTVKLLFGAAFAPAALALQILASTFVVTYVAIIYAITLMMMERAWTLTAISAAGLVVNVLLNVVLVGPSMSRFGPGGGGAGCALALLGTELFVTSAMIALVGKGAVDRRTVAMVGKSVGACALVGVCDWFLRGLGLGFVRLGLDAALYAIVVVTTGAFRTREVVSVVASALRDKSRRAVSAEPRNG